MDEVIDKEAIRDTLRRANIGQKLWNLQLPKFGPVGKELRKLLDSGDFADDYADGKTYAIHGEASRIDLFAALAREATIYNYGAYYVTIRQMLNMLQYDDRVDHLYQKGILCISDFYEGGVESPFQGYERSNLEEVLNYRVDAGKSIFICSSAKVSEIKWWSPTLLHKINQNVREVYVGKGNRRG